VTFPVLTSKDNPLIRTIRLVAERQRRAPADLVVAEGIRVLEEAERAGCRFEAVLASEAFGAMPRERRLLEAWTASNVTVRRAAPSLLKQLSDVVSPQGAVALVQVPVLELAGLRLPGDPLILCLCGIQDPGNVGALLRSALATGVAVVCSIAGTASARNPKAVRAGAGAFFRLPVVEGLQPPEVSDFCGNNGIPMFQAAARARRSFWTVNLKSAVAILLGNETRGVAESAWQDVPALRIPMTSGVESLNVSAAGSVLLFEAFRQRSGAAAREVESDE